MIKSPSTYSSSYVPTTDVSKPRVSDSVRINTYQVRTEPEQGNLYSPEQTSLHESEGSVGNSRSSTQMNSYSDSGYQEVSSFHNSQNLGKAENRQQHSLTGTTSNHLVRNARAEGQTLVQVRNIANAFFRLVVALKYILNTNICGRPPEEYLLKLLCIQCW
uniref:Uncharacterized protein n=1 Tax=Chelonoidis abingdonii TaxID=106734 RepID=A0A8C0ISB8_CHEAB